MEIFNNDLYKIGKKIWTGSFSSGSITISNGNKYTIICMIIDSVVCYGNWSYGIGGLIAYGGYSMEYRAYRFSVTISGNDVNLTIDSTNKGGSNGTSNAPITTIYGLF